MLADRAIRAARDRLDFDIGVTGFSIPEINTDPGTRPEEPTEPGPRRSSAGAGCRAGVAEPGDVWHLGQHRLICGDARSRRRFVRLLEGRERRWSSPIRPTTCRVDGNISGSRQVRHRGFAMAAGEMSGAEFTAFLRPSWAMPRPSTDGAIHFVCMDWRHLFECLRRPRTRPS